MDCNQEIDVPPFFLCPVSLQIMRDPVTVSSGITYDRESIEQWIYNNKKYSCPVTKQPLSENIDNFLTPNHTLRRLIQSWCTINASYGIERIPTPKPPATKSLILKLINEASSSPQRLVKCLDKLKCIATESSASKRVLETTSVAVEFLARIIITENKSSEVEVAQDSNVGNEALSILAHLQISDERVLRKLLAEKDGALMDALAKIIQRSNNVESRAYAIELMKLLIQVAEPTQAVSLKNQHFMEIIGVLQGEISPKATKAALKFLALACPWGRNRVRAVEAGAVAVLVNLLVDSGERRTSEMVFAVLDLLSGCAEGRAELIAHAAGLALVSKKLLRVSHFATERGVRILYALAKFSGSPSVVQEMVQYGVVTKLCLVLQVECEAKTKEKAREILKLHGKVWRNSPCAPAHVLGALGH